MLSVQKGYELHSADSSDLWCCGFKSNMSYHLIFTAAFGCRTVSLSLRKLGVEEQDIKGLVMKQLGVWFGLPVVVSIIVSAIVVMYFLQSVSVEISAYIGIGALITQVSIIIFILILLLVCYFLSTWILFRRSITE